jgi:hypothetical protein
MPCCLSGLCKALMTSGRIQVRIEMVVSSAWCCSSMQKELGPLHGTLRAAVVGDQTAIEILCQERSQASCITRFHAPIGK